MYNVTMATSGQWKEAFLAKLQQIGSPKAAARSLDLPWSTVTSARRRSAEFRRDWDDAIAAADAAIEETIQARAREDPEYALKERMANRRVSEYGRDVGSGPNTVDITEPQIAILAAAGRFLVRMLADPFERVRIQQQLNRLEDNK